jgi:16S rRNA (cytidine1402-2'-O)-methyltransferase
MIVNLTIPNNKNLKNGLYVVPTPIGNLSDITIRAIEILKNSDYILCEDTRVSKKLFDKYKIKSKLISYHKFNEKKNLNKIINLLVNKKIISLISDAGTPTISDPGNLLINECVKKNIEIIPLPGPSSVSSAISISGFSEKFFFYGFFPEKKKKLLEDLNILTNLDCSIVFFISPKKINKIIPFLKEKFIGREIVICREISKYYEEFIRSEISELDKLDTNIKGEITLVISEKKKGNKFSHLLSESDKRNISKLINKLSIKEIIKLINKENKISKKLIYDYCLKLKNEN